MYFELEIKLEYCTKNLVGKEKLKPIDGVRFGEGKSTMDIDINFCLESESVLLSCQG